MKPQKQTGQSGWSRLSSHLQKLPMVAMAMVIAALFNVNIGYGQIAISSTTAVTTNFVSLGSGTSTGNFTASAANVSLPTSFRISDGSLTSSKINPVYSTDTTSHTTLKVKAAGKVAGILSDLSTSTTANNGLGIYTAETGTQFFGPNSIMASYQNTNATQYITSLAVSYDISVFQRGTAPAKIDFYYSFDGTNWIFLRQGSLDRHKFPTIQNANSSLSVTTAPSSFFGATIPTVNATFNISGLNLTPASGTGSKIYFRWEFSNNGFKYNNFGSGGMNLALKDVSVTATMGSASSNPQAYITLSSSSISKGTGITIQAISTGNVTGDQTVTVDVNQEIVDMGDTVGGYTPAPSGSPLRSTMALTIPNGTSTSGTVTFTPSDTIHTGNESLILAISDVTSGIDVSTSSTNTPYRTLGVTETNDVVSLTGTAYTENFDKLDSAYTEVSSILPAGWYIGEAGSNGNTTYSADDGGQATGNTFSYGVEHSNNRALGNYPTSITKLQGAWGAKFKNNTGGTISNVTITYTGEQWSNFGDGNSNTINFYYSKSVSSLTPTVTTSWTAVSALNFTSPVNTVVAGGSILNGSLTANQTTLSATISGLNVANGGTFWIKWEHGNNSANKADAMGIDNFKIQVTANPTSYYLTTPNADPTIVANWNTAINGTGTSPANFTDNNQLFNVRASTTLTSSWTVSGTASKVVLGDSSSNISLIVPSGDPFTGTIDVSANAALTLRDATIPTFGVLDNASTVVYDGAVSQSVTQGTYGNLTVQNNSATKTFPGNVTTNGTFLINNTKVSAPSFILLNLNGNYQLVGTVTFNANWRLNVRHTFAGTASQTITSGVGTDTIPMFGFNCTKTAGTLSIASSSTVIDNSNSTIFDLHTGSCVFSDGGATILNGLHLELNGQSGYSSYSLSGTVVMTCESGSSNVEANTVPVAILAQLNNLTIDTVLFNGHTRATSSNGNKQSVTIVNSAGVGNTPTYINGILAIKSGKLILSSTQDLMNTLNINTIVMSNNSNNDTTILNPGTKSNSSTGAPYSSKINLTGGFTKSGAMDTIKASGGRLLLNFTGNFPQAYLDDNHHNTRNTDFQVSAGSTLQVNSNLQVYGPDTVIVKNGAFLDLGNQSLSDNLSSGAKLHMYYGSTIRTSNAGGVSGASNLSAANMILDPGASYVFYKGGAQSTGLSGLTVGNPKNIVDSVSGTQLTLDNSLTMTGNLNIYSGTGFIQPDGKSITKSGSTTVTLNGNFDVNDANGYRGTSTGALQGFVDGDITGSGTVRYVSNSAQAFSAGNYTNVSVMDGTTKTLAGNVTINGTLTLSSGNMKIVNDTLKMGTSSSISGGSSASFVYFDPTGTKGRMQANFTGSYTFPIGDGYNPIIINNPGTATTFDVTVSDGITDRNGVAITDSVVNRTWSIIPATAVTGVTVTPQWDNGTDLIGSVFDPASTFVSMKPHTTSIWTPTQTATASTAGSGTTYTLTSGSVDMTTPGGTYDFGVGSESVTSLPVTLLNFNAKKVNSYATLTWNTASEINNRGFEIERTFDAMLTNWTKIGFADGHGNSNVFNHYSFNDKDNNLDQSIFPMVYYRLKQFDFNGATTYSNVQAVACSNQSTGNFSCYPNPVDQILNISWKNNATNATAIIKITDMMGKIVAVKSIVSQGNESKTYQVDMATVLPGTYDVCLMSGNDTEHFSILKK